MVDRLALFGTALALFGQLSTGLVVHHEVSADDPLAPMTYQTFSGVAMFSPKDAPSKTAPGNGQSFIDFTLTMNRMDASESGAVELIVIPDTNINDIGVSFQGQMHICCSPELVTAEKCDSETLGKLIVKKDIAGLYRYYVAFDKGQKTQKFTVTDEIQVTGIHVFALASCLPTTGALTLAGRSKWMNPYGHLPGDVYGYWPFYGWMIVVYLALAAVWFTLNAIHYKQLLYVQNCITGVLVLALLEMVTWYVDYTHLNRNGYRHHGPFILGLMLSVTRRMLSRMLVVAVCLGYGVVKPSLGDTKNKLIALGCVYWVFALLFEALIHYNQTEKVETWMRVILIPPVAVVNGIFWWWTFVALNRTIESLKIRKQSAKLNLYKSFTLVLVASLLSAIGFAIYEMWYVLRELYFKEWQRLWLMEVGFWQILFTVIFVAMMILWRPTDRSGQYAYAVQISGNEDDDDDEEEMQFGKPDTMDAFDDQLQGEHQPKFTIDDDDSDSNDSHPASIELVEATAKLD